MQICGPCKKPMCFQSGCQQAQQPPKAVPSDAELRNPRLRIDLAREREPVSCSHWGMH